MDRNWDRVASLLERALELARTHKHPSTIQMLSEEVVEECRYLERPTPNVRLAYILEQRAAGVSWTNIGAELGVSRQYVQQLHRAHERRLARAAGAGDEPITFESHVDRLDLPERIRRTLRERGVTTVAELFELDPTTTPMKRIGPTGWRRICSELARHGLGAIAEHPALGADARLAGGARKEEPSAKLVGAPTRRVESDPT